MVFVFTVRREEVFLGALLREFSSSPLPKADPLSRRNRALCCFPGEWWSLSPLSSESEPWVAAWKRSGSRRERPERRRASGKFSNS
ncbi:hypothetical protein TYRP_017583 [Tyrophagus putrescentiae]|nr:hypothetical protein TYRP_017583 [Tyrophagus putrescentiae]